MKILVLTSRLPFPVDRGDRYRAYHILETLGTRHEVTLLSFTARPEEAPHRAALESLGVRVHTVHLPRGRSIVKTAFAAMKRARPLQLTYYESEAMRALVRKHARGADAVLAHLMRMAQYLDEVPAGIRRIVDLCDCVSSEYRGSVPHRRGAAKLLFREEARRAAAYERELVAGGDEIWLVTRAEVSKICGGRSAPPNVLVVPNGVRIPAESPTPPRATEAPRVLFTGNLRVPHNVDAARVLVRDVLPWILTRLPGATVHLAGADASPLVAELARPGVTIQGYIEDLPEFLRTGDVFAAPMRFVSGIQTKILEAMAAGIPVVTSPLVNRGLGAVSGVHLLLASDPIEFADAVARIARDPSLASELSREGRRFVGERFRWDAVLARF